MHRIIIVITLLSTLFSQSKVGTSSAAFLGIGVGARSMGMGGAVTAMTNDASIIYWNPGGIARLDRSETVFSKSDWLVQTQLNLVSTVIKLNASNALGIYYTHLNYGEEEITDLHNQIGTDQYWSASDIAVGLSFGRNLTDRFSFGATGKYISQHIYNSSATSFGLDLGLLYRTANEKVRIGMSISNFGPDMTMDGKDLYKKIDLDPENQGHNENIVAKLKTDPWPLPLFFRVGTAVKILNSKSFILTMSADAYIPSDDVEMVNLGIEAMVMNRIFLQTGYKGLGSEDGEEGLTFGVGTQFYAGGFDIKLHYAVQDFGKFGLIPHISLAILFR